MSKHYRVLVTVIEVEKAEVTTDHYHKTTTTGVDRDTELLKGSYALPLVDVDGMPQKVTNFLHELKKAAR